MSKAKKIVELISNWQELSAAVTRGSLVNARIETAKAEYIEKELELRKVLQAAIEPDSLILKGIKKRLNCFAIRTKKSSKPSVLNISHMAR